MYKRIRENIQSAVNFIKTEEVEEFEFNCFPQNWEMKQSDLFFSIERE